MTDAKRVHAFTDDVLGRDDATGVAQRIRAGEISAAEAVEAAIARVERVNPTLNGLMFDDFDRARRRAAAVRTPRGAFAGVPTFIKDNLTVAGMPLTMGSLAVNPRPLPRDGEFTKQFLDTGVIPLGTTTMPEFGWTATTERVGAEPTRNPWDTAYSSGGSSGGTAAMVASGAVPFAHGNDGGGSIRIPASACGLVGLKTTRDRFRGDPTTDAAPVSVVTNGVLTRSVRDTANFVAALERSWSNPKLPPVGLVEHPVVRRLRVGVAVDSPLVNATDAETRAAVEATVALLGSLGHEVVDYEPNIPAFFKKDFEDYWSLLAFAIKTDGKRMFDKDFDASKLDPLTLGLARRFLRRKIAKTPLFLARLQASGAAYEKRFGDNDLVLTPVLSHTTPRLGYIAEDLDFETQFERLVNYVGFTPLHNAAGVPAISLPLGRTADGRPIGVMFSARKGQERLLLELALELEEAQPFARIDA